MNFHINLVFLVVLNTGVFGFPQNAIDNFSKHGAKDFEASGTGPDEPIRGSVKVVKISPHFLRHGGIFGRGLPIKETRQGRGAFPAFLALGRAGPSLLERKPVHSLPLLRESQHGADTKRKHGLEMWQRVLHKSNQGKEAESLPINLKDASKESCSAIPFTQRVTAEGCETVTVHNKLCFGQCSTMFVPPSGELTGHHSASCSRCAPSKAHAVTVPLRCGTEVRQRRVMVVEECKCHAGREGDRVEAMLPMRL
ncbi:DAN domain family member 5 [Chanos chanos]|uniref:DAN domain family member 5 n=1 Tax=Chanos chanos TaxID=29144 RepID=A0A6J2VUA5_CHACN|nr:DAN domain family member 5-like [Chanos chanos]